MRRFLKGIFSSYVNWHWAIVSVMLFLGFLLLFLYNIYKGDEKTPPEQLRTLNWIKQIWILQILPFTGILGKTILAGGFLAFFLKSFQFIGIFRDEISKVVLGEDFLRKTTFEYKKQVWSNTTRSLYQSYFNDISNRVTDIIYNKYIPKGIDFYFQDAMVSYEFEYFDDEHICIIENQSFTVRTNKKATPFKSELFLIKKDDKSDKSDIEITDFTINNVKVKAKSFKEKIIKDRGMITKTLSFNKRLKNKEIYNVKRSIKTIQSTLLNVFWRNEIHRYTKRFTLILRQNQKFEIDIVPFGLNIDLRKVPYTEIYRHEGVLIPGEGYVILVKKRTH